MLGYLLAILFGILTLAAPLIVVAQTPTPVHDPSKWHAPGFGHEHGDAPSQWLSDAFAAHPEWAPYWSLGFDGPFNTSGKENLLPPDGKHFSFKGVHLEYKSDLAAEYGFRDQDGGWLDGYLIGHISGTPGDRGAAVHSFRLFLADSGGGLTIRQGWANTGDPATNRIPKYCQAGVHIHDCATYGDPGQRPIVLTITSDDINGTFNNAHRSEGFEQWYFSIPGANIGWGENSPTLFNRGEKASDLDPAGWSPTNAQPGANGQAFGQLRLVEVVAGKPTGIPAPGVAFWTTPEGSLVSDQNSPECHGPCLLQWVSSTYKGIGQYNQAKNQTDHSRVQKQWPVAPGITIAN